MNFLKYFLFKLIYLLKPKKAREPGEIDRGLYGVSKDVEDDRDYKVGDILVVITPPESSKLNINPYNFVKNQGQWNSCASHAMTTAIEIMCKIKNIGFTDIELSERYAFWCVREQDGTLPNNVGTTIRNIMKVGRDYGVCPEKLCPYVTPLMNVEPDMIAQGFTSFWKMKGYYRVADVEELKKTLYQGFPVILGVHVNSSFRSLSGEIVVKDNESTYGGHAILAYGYDKDGVMCINSWDKIYKDNGCMKLPYKYIEKYCFDMWTFTL